MLGSNAEEPRGRVVPGQAPRPRQRRRPGPSASPRSSRCPHPEPGSVRCSCHAAGSCLAQPGRESQKLRVIGRSGNADVFPAVPGRGGRRFADRCNPDRRHGLLRRPARQGAARLAANAGRRPGPVKSSRPGTAPLRSARDRRHDSDRPSGHGWRPTLLAAEVKQPRVGSTSSSRLIDSTGADRRNAEAGHFRRNRRPFADRVDGKAAKPIQQLAAHLHGVRARQKNPVELVAGPAAPIPPLQVRTRGSRRRPGQGRERVSRVRLELQVRAGRRRAASSRGEQRADRPRRLLEHAHAPAASAFRCRRIRRRASSRTCSLPSSERICAPKTAPSRRRSRHRPPPASGRCRRARP